MAGEPLLASLAWWLALDSRPLKWSGEFDVRPCKGSRRTREMVQEGVLGMLSLPLQEVLPAHTCSCMSKRRETCLICHEFKC